MEGFINKKAITATQQQLFFSFVPTIPQASRFDTLNSNRSPTFCPEEFINITLLPNIWTTIRAIWFNIHQDHEAQKMLLRMDEVVQTITFNYNFTSLYKKLLYFSDVSRCSCRSTPNNSVLLPPTQKLELDVHCWLNILLRITSKNSEPFKNASCACHRYVLPGFSRFFHYLCSLLRDL